MKYEKTIKEIEEFIQEMTHGLEGVVIGLSGGIDSSFVAYLAVRALGKEKVYGLLMPYGKQSTEDAELVAKKLGIDYNIENIKPKVDAWQNFMDILAGSSKEEAGSSKKDLPKGNLIARERMCGLYLVANKKNMLVLGTTNKSEMEIAYFTKHGDGAVDIEPIAHLYKTQVWELAKYINVPNRIIEKEPSAELWEGQTDKNELEFDYQTLDRYLKGETKGIEKKVIDRIEGLRRSSWHKKNMPSSLEEEK